MLLRVRVRVFSTFLSFLMGMVSVATARLTADPQAEVSCFSDSAGRADPVKKSAVLAVDSTQAATQSRPS